MRELPHGPHRFTELRDALPGISPHTLTSRLRQFEDHGIITRTAYADPPHVGCQLAPLDERLHNVLEAMAAWAESDPASAGILAGCDQDGCRIGVHPDLRGPDQPRGKRIPTGALSGAQRNWELLFGAKSGLPVLLHDVQARTDVELTVKKQNRAAAPVADASAIIRSCPGVVRPAAWTVPDLVDR